MEKCLVIFKLLGRILFFGRQKPEWLMIVCGWNLCSPLYEYTTVTRCFMRETEADVGQKSSVPAQCKAGRRNSRPFVPNTYLKINDAAIIVI